VQEARAAGLRVRGYLTMVFGDPWEGDVPVEQAVDVAERLWRLGVDEPVAREAPPRGLCEQMT
jgi:hydroxymethylglutaryl-CoA lyase